MKQIFIAILAVAALAACNKAEVIKQAEGEVIAFGDAFVDNATKAFYGSGTEETSLTSFNVYGTIDDAEDNPVVIYDGDPVSGTVGAESVWQCTNSADVQYWVAGAKYNFAALVDVPSANVTLSADKLPASFTYTYDSDSPKDVLYARSTTDIIGQASNNPKVAFTFGHMLSKVKFTLTNTTVNTDYTYIISGIKITNAIQSGSCAVATKKWTSQTTGTTTFGNAGTDVLMIPGSYDAKVEFVLDLFYKDSKISTTTYSDATAQTATVNFEAGNAYNFNISVGLDQPIQFTVTQNPTWTDAGSNPGITL